MTTNYHTPIANGASNAASTWNTPLSALDSAISAVSGAGGTFTLANGGTSNTTLDVDSTTGFVVGATVVYTYGGGSIEYNTIAAIPSSTRLTLTNTPSGAIADNAVIAQVTPDVAAAATAINYGGGVVPTLSAAMRWAGAERYNVRAYGATGDGATDDTAAIQAAIDDAGLTGGSVYLPAGTYLISATLTHNTAGQYSKIIGDGIRITTIKADSGCSTMLNLATSSGFHGRKLIQGITFAGNDNASIGIDASYLRYSIIQFCEFTRMASGGTAVKAGNWVGRFINNMIDGGDSGGTAVSDGLRVVDTASPSGVNNYVVSQNAFTTCLTGLLVDCTPRSLIVAQNTFDSCDGPGLWLRVGCRSCVIRDNYFEACGAGAGASVEVAASTFENWAGSIVGHSLYNAPNSTALRSLEITGNLFTGVTSGTHMTLSNLDGVNIHDNYLDDAYTGLNSFVKLDWLGALYTTSKLVVINEKDIGDSVTQLVELAGDNATQNHSKLQVNWGKYPSESSTGGVMLGNPRGWTQTGTAWASDTISTSYFDGSQPIFQMTRGDSTSEYRADLDLISESGALNAAQSNWANRYFRIEGFCRGDGGAGGGWIIVAYSADNGSSYTELVSHAALTTDTWTTFRGITFYVPSDATDLRFRWKASTAQAFSFSQFRIVDAGTPIGQAQLFHRQKQYTVTNSTVDRVFNADSTSIDELADVLGTLILDLQNSGVLR